MIINLSPSFFNIKKVIFILFDMIILLFLLNREANHLPSLLLVIFSAIILIILILMKKISFKKDILKIGTKNIDMSEVRDIYFFNTQLLSLMVVYLPSNPIYSRWQVCMIQRFGLSKSHFNKISEFKNGLLEYSRIPKKRIMEIFD